MSLVLSEEQQLLQHTTREFVTGRSSLRRIRELRDQGGDGFSRDLWREMAHLGWAGIVIPDVINVGSSSDVLVVSWVEGKPAGLPRPTAACLPARLFWVAHPASSLHEHSANH